MAEYEDREHYIPLRKSDLVELTTLDATIKEDIRYATDNNFLGHAVYTSAKAYMQRPAAEALVRARRRYLVADRKSYAYAHLLGTDLQSFLRDVVVVDGLVNRPLDVLPDVRAGDAAICFSLRRYATSSLATARFMHAAGAAIIGITDDSSSELAALASVVLVVETTSQSFVDSPTAVASTVHALATLAAAQTRGARTRLAQRDELARRLGVYEEDEASSGPQLARQAQGKRAEP
jgi:DNA-binding MurR/RpiR family transcriptional regulator